MFGREVARDDQRAQHVAVLDLLDRLLPAVHAHRVDGVEQPLALLGEVDAVAAELHDRRLALEPVVEGDLGLVGASRQREADQHRDHDRVEHQQRDEQRRAPQDLQVLERAASASVAALWRNSTNASSKSSPVVPTSCSRSRGEPSKSSSPSASTISWLGVAVGLLDVVRGVDDGRALAREAQDELPQARALARIERGARLVEQQHLGLGEQADRDVHALAVAARERAHLIAARGRAGRSARASGRPWRAGRRSARGGRTGTGSPRP